MRGGQGGRWLEQGEKLESWSPYASSFGKRLDSNLSDGIQTRTMVNDLTIVPIIPTGQRSRSGSHHDYSLVFAHLKTIVGWR